MSATSFHARSGAAVLALMLMAVVILGSLLAFGAVAVISVGNSARALEIGRQDAALVLRLERSVQQAASTVLADASEQATGTFLQELGSELALVGFGASTVGQVQIEGVPTQPRSFPDFSAQPGEPTAPSARLLALATPQLREYLGPRVIEAPPFFVRFTVSRKGLAAVHSFPIQVECRPVSVPLTRFGVVPYDLPHEAGSTSGVAAWPPGVASDALAPLGLVPGRDPADTTRSDPEHAPFAAEANSRPAHFRYAAALSSAYQYTFSSAYLQRAAEGAGPTHFVRIGYGPQNPVLEGASENGDSYEIDLARSGHGSLGGTDEMRNVVLIRATGSGQSVVIHDSGGETTPMLMVLVGAADAGVGRLTVLLPAVISRPLILVCCKAEVVASGPTEIRGALFLDPDCTLAAPAGGIALSHVSYWAGGPVAGTRFEMRPMPASADALSPRVVYMATGARMF